MSAWTPRVVEGLVAPDETAPSFTAMLDVDPGNPVNVVVGVPDGVSAWFGARGHVPVLGFVDDVGITATLVPVGEGRHRLFLNEPMRQATRLGVGDRATIRLWRDPTDRDAIAPDDLLGAIADAGLADAFTQLPPSHRREYVLWVEDARRPDTRARRIGRVVDAVRDRAGD